MKRVQHFIILILLAAGQDFAQSNNIDSTFRAIESMFESGAYVNAEVEARRFAEGINVSDSVRSVAEKWIAFSLVAQGKTSLAQDHFAVLLRINPQFELDPILTSPKILAVFDETKARLANHEKQEADTAAYRPLRRSTGVSFRTIVFPGWEQLHANRATAGYLFLGGGVATLGAGIALEALRSSARNEYLSATNPPGIEAKYSTYNKYYRAETYAFSAFALIYIVSEIDVFGNANSASIIFQPASPSYRGSSLSLRINL
ncbi:MAG: hypothetical protein WBZ48_07780 [Bacteroidota bacterium]